MLNRLAVDTPIIGDAYMVLRSNLRGLRVNQNTHVVIEGFPRSANTYAMFGLELALGDRFEVRGHTHSIRNVRRSVRFGVPVIVIIRDPRSVVSSFVQFAPGLKITTALNGYSKFHRGLLPCLNRIQISRFETIVSDLGTAIHETNRRFDRSFNSYERTAANERLLRERIEHNSRIFSGGNVTERSVARPSANRRAPDEVLSDLKPSEQRALRKAETIYQKLLSAAT